MNIFATVLTNAAPSANYRGESEQNRSVIQRVTQGRYEFAVISPEAMRNALRETLSVFKLPCNRSRLHNEEQLAVRFQDYPYPERFVDDFFFGYLVADRKQVPAAVVAERQLQFKRDSVLRMNLAKALEPYRHDAIFTQSPLTVSSPWQNATSSALLHRETTVTAYQYPFALNLDDCRLDDMQNPVEGVQAPGGGTYATRGEQYRDWLRHLLVSIAELNGVAGNHARSYFEMSPSSILVRATDSLVAGYDSYAFRPDGSLPEVIDGIENGDYPGEEFYLGGRVVREVLDAEQREKLEQKGVHLRRLPRQALEDIAILATGCGFQPESAKD
ncbi:MAG: type I-B CRISPR-associated protein Cas7/Cst2/DevR [Chloroflexota bacterium]|nr:MAG: type I-B CRISPR-associated protein Cas7/Cst2/DevR [Chloroflexota bacterium]